MSHEQHPRSQSGRRAGLVSRLFATQVLVLLIAAITVWLVAAFVGPRQFHLHLDRATDGQAPPATVAHAEEAFRQASGYSLAIAGTVGLAAAVAVATLAARRIGGRLAVLSEAALDVADGRYSVRVPSAGLGQEFDELASAVNLLAQRLEETETTRRRLLSDLAHELRTPLATIEAWLEALADGIVSGDALAVAVPQAQTRRIQRLIDDIAAVSRAEERAEDLQMRLVDPRALVAWALEAQEPRARTQRVHLAGRAPQHLPQVLVDSDRIAEVLGNLVDNALKHTPAGGTITLSSSLRRSDSGDEVAITVADTGDGIPAHALPHVFERFYRVDAARDREHGGSGIGLAISQALVHAHDGRLTVESQGPGRGAAFTLTLPVSAA